MDGASAGLRGNLAHISVALFLHSPSHSSLNSHCFCAWRSEFECLRAQRCLHVACSRLHALFRVVHWKQCFSWVSTSWVDVRMFLYPNRSLNRTGYCPSTYPAGSTTPYTEKAACGRRQHGGRAESHAHSSTPVPGRAHTTACKRYLAAEV